jgi:ribosomal protein L37AE/L43A
MQVRHGKLIAADIHSSSHGMMAFSGISDTFTLKETSGEFVLLHSHKSEMDGTDEKLYRADADALKKIEEIAERENLWAWGEMRIDPEKDDRPKMFDYSSSWGITLYTDDKESSIFSFNCDTAKFYGGGDVVGQIRDILHSFADEKNLLSERHLPVTDPRVLEMKKNMFGMPMGTDVKPDSTKAEDSGEWKCPVCNAEGNKGKFCVNCAAPKPAEAAEKEPEQPAQTDFVYTGGKWKCPKCGRTFKNENQSHYCGKSPETVDEYILAQDADIREQLQRVREAIRDELPDAAEKISWSMPTWWNGRNIIHFAAQKKHIGLYPGPEAVAFFCCLFSLNVRC